MRCLYFRCVCVCVWNRTGHCRNSFHFSSLLLSYLDLLYMQSVPRACSLFGINLRLLSAVYQQMLTTVRVQHQGQLLPEGGERQSRGEGGAICNSSIVFQHQRESKSKSKDVNVSLTMKSECRDSLTVFSHKTGDSQNAEGLQIKRSTEDCGLEMCRTWRWNIAGLARWHHKYYLVKLNVNITLIYNTI